METLIETIRSAIADNASDDARAAGADACRTLLAALDAKAGEATTPMIPAAPGCSNDTPNPAAPPVATAVSNAIQSTDPAQIANVISALRGIPVDELLDLAIARMRAALPAGVETPRVEPLKFHIVQLPRSGGSKK